MPAFKFDAQTAFLTYAQCDVACNELIAALRAVGDIDWARVCRERHQDGEPHLHAVVRFTKRVQSRNSRVFDVSGHHPNIQPIRSIAKALAYVAKDGEFVDVGTVPASTTRTAREVYDLAKSASEEEFWVAAAEARIPYQYAARFRQLAHSSCNETIQEYDGSMERERADLQITALPDDGKTIVCMGPTGVGKTSWALRVSPKPALWVRHIDVLRSFRAGYHKSIIFDDMCFKHLPRTAQLHLADNHQASHIHCRYGHAIIPAGVVKIVTCNEYPFLDDPAINRRIHSIDLY